MTTRFLYDGPEDAPATIVLAHGAGAAMDAPGMTALAGALAGVGLRVARFEFGYMAARREGSRRPPPSAGQLLPEYRAALVAIHTTGALVIGGKSMGGRVASMIADELYEVRHISGLLCFGYPFHPVGKPDQLRTAHLKAIRTPTLICQGTRDAFGSREEVAGYPLSAAIELCWLEDGDHELRPRRASGFSAADHLDAAAAATRRWIARITGE
jgi:uncharacterized protein